MATQAELDEARSALHNLRIGKAVVSVKKNGREIEYSKANVSELVAYVRDLENALSTGTKVRRRPARFF